MHKNQVILLMITDIEKLYYLVAKKFSALFSKITPKHDGKFYNSNCLHSFRTENKLKEHENVCRNHDYYYIEISKEITNILHYNLGEKSMKFRFIIYADMETLLEKINKCYSNP